MSMTNKARIKLWADELIHGEHHQGRNRLTRKGPDGVERDCCMGVGSKVAKDNGLELHVFYDSASGVTTYNGWDDYFPTEVWQWYGFNDGNPIVGIYSCRCGYPECDTGGTVTASHANDSMEKTFEEIGLMLYEYYRLDEV
jgi:hypothetical protein